MHKATGYLRGSTKEQDRIGLRLAVNKGEQTESLETLIQQAGSSVNLLRSAPLGRYIFPGIPAEFTNWRDEVRAWKNSVALLEQSYHMMELHLRGPGAIKLLAAFSVNKIDNFPIMRAKQLVLAGHDGNYIADAVIFHKEAEFFRVVGAPFASDWLEFNAIFDSYDVEVARSESWSVRKADRDVFRFQLQGPHALELMRDVTGNALPDIKFFHIGELKIAGKTVRALRHGMAGELGFELYGPWVEQDAVREAIVTAGAAFGLRKVGADAYSVTGAESGWMPMPLPAIYHGESMKAYREWLSPHHLESVGSLGGSLISKSINDYYVDPIELGYCGIIDFNREFLGRDALREKRDNQKRRKVALKCNEADVLEIVRSSLFPHGNLPGKYISMPSPMYATFESDAVMKNGEIVGVSQWSCYTSNADAFISGALLNVEQSEPGTEVTLMWGEPESQRACVERHEIRPIRATVCKSPYFEHTIKSFQGQQRVS